MPLQSCRVDEKPGYKWGESGACYVYDPDDDESRRKAKQRAILQGSAIEKGDLPKSPAKVYAELAATGLDLTDRAALDFIRESLGLRAFAARKTCDECGKTRVISRFPEDKRSKDGYGKVCVGCRFDSQYGEELATVDLKGIEILASGGPYHGTGSPSEGDYLTDEELEERAENTNRFIGSGELRSYLKIGHSDEQKLLKNSGLHDGEKPAAGWFENFRVEGGKLLADAKDVPRKLARLLKVKAFRTRSVEMRSLSSQNGDDDSKRYPVISAVALLGATLPAVRTLDDIAALYADVEADPPEGVETLDYEVGGVVWNPDTGFAALQSKLASALNADRPNDKPGYWVQDVSLAAARDDDGALVYRAIVSDWADPAVAWIVPFDVDDGDVEPAPSSEWRMAQQAWVEVASGYAEERDRLRGREVPPTVNTKPEMGKANESKSPAENLSDAQVVALAGTFEIEEPDDAKRREAVAAKLAEFAPSQEPPAPDPEPDPEPDPDEPPAALPAGMIALKETDLEVLKANANAGAAVAKTFAERERDSLLDKLIGDGKLDPGKREFWAGEYDKNPDGVTLLLSELPVNPEYVKVYGSDVSGTEDHVEMADRMYEEWAAFSGITRVEGVAS